MDERIFDFGPARDAPDRPVWEKLHGAGPVRIVVFSAGECIERDPRRYRRELPPGVRATNE